MLRYSLALVIAVVVPLGVLFSYLALKPYRQSVEDARKLSQINAN
jgi:hypothetical protein